MKLKDAVYDAGPFAEDPVQVTINIGHYNNGRLAIYLEQEDEDRFLTCTVNLPHEDCPDGEVWVKDWSENEGMAEWLMAQQIIEPGATCNTQTGFAQAERFRLTAVAIEQIGKELVK